MEKNYTAIIGDIIRSQLIEDRKSAQEELARVLVSINSSYSDFIASKFTITLGDEFQGLLFSSEKAIEITQKIQRNLYPIEVRFGIGIGSISTDINPEVAIGADGPGYYYARRAIDTLKGRERKKGVAASDVIIITESIEADAVNLINAILILLKVIRCRWSNGQRKAFWCMQDEKTTQSNIAKLLGISQPCLQQIITTGRFYAYQEAMSAVEGYLRGIDRRTGSGSVIIRSDKHGSH